MYEKLIEVWIGIWFFLVPIVTVYNMYYSKKLIEKIEKVEREQKNVDVVKEVKRLIDMYEDVKDQCGIKS